MNFKVLGPIMKNYRNLPINNKIKDAKKKLKINVNTVMVVCKMIGPKILAILTI